MSTQRIRQRPHDHERATLYLYLVAHGNPPWGTGADGQTRVLSLLTGWSKKRARAALERAVGAGYADGGPRGVRVP
jgi:hypothetical protein